MIAETHYENVVAFEKILEREESWNSLRTPAEFSQPFNVVVTAFSHFNWNNRTIIIQWLCNFLKQLVGIIISWNKLSFVPENISHPIESAWKYLFLRDDHSKSLETFCMGHACSGEKEKVNDGTMTRLSLHGFWLCERGSSNVPVIHHDKSLLPQPCALYFSIHLF